MQSIERLSWQRVLFANPLNRFQLLRIGRPTKSPSELKIRVIRNHAFEPVASALPAFLAYSDLCAEIDIGTYDDSVNLPPAAKVAAEIVWLDFDRYDQIDDDALADWLVGRLNGLRSLSSASIIVANAAGSTDRDRKLNCRLHSWVKATAGAVILDVAMIAERLGVHAFDEGRAPLTGTRVSDGACLEIARLLGFGVLPDLFVPRIKAIAIDLDETLYAGVLGEQGIKGVVLTEDHKRLQQLLVDLAEKGVLLSVVSRNDAEDVTALFRLRDDFPLKAEHIGSWQVSWGSKADAIRRAASDFRVSTDTFLFIDDNVGELASVSGVMSDVRLLYAGFSASETADALEHFPALWPRAVLEVDSLRVADLRANSERDVLAEQLTTEDYLEALETRLTFSLDPRDDLARLRDLSAKTNQFNLAAARLDELSIRKYLDAPDCFVVHVRLSDKLSDSGSIASLYLRSDRDVLIVDELCISCRAMGRMLEDCLITEAIRRVSDEVSFHVVRFIYTTAPRNMPARRWLAAFGANSLDSCGFVDVSWSPDRTAKYVSSMPIEIRWK